MHRLNLPGQVSGARFMFLAIPKIVPAGSEKRSHSGQFRYRRWYAGHLKNSETVIDSPLNFALISAQIPDLVAYANPPNRKAAGNFGPCVASARRNPQQTRGGHPSIEVRAWRLTAPCALEVCSVAPQGPGPYHSLQVTTAIRRCGGQRTL